MIDTLAAPSVPAVLTVPPGAGPLLPESFLVGISDSGFQSEGGYNGPGQPENNWAAWERSGRAEVAGEANAFWTRYPEFFATAARAGANSYRTSVEWARVVPEQGAPDLAALDHYAEILASCRDHGLEPVVALHHFTHPSWLGPDFWLRDDAVERFAEWVELAVSKLAPHCSRWITINEINAYGIGSYLIGYFPPGRRFARRSYLRTIDAMLAAHVRAFEIIHRISPGAQVGTANYAFWSYDVDRVLIDVLSARDHGVPRDQVGRWLAQRRKEHHATVLSGLGRVDRLGDHLLHGALAVYMNIDAHLPRTLDAVYASPHERTLDVTQVNYYDPRLARYLRRPGRTSGGQRRWGPDPAHWEQVPAPQHLTAYLRANHEPGREVWILENGLCNPVVDGVAHPRPDGWERPDYFAAHLQAVLAARSEGIDVQAWFQWSVYDNYQWGEWECRFGLCRADHGPDGPRFHELDAMGADSVGALRHIVDALRAGDRSPLSR